MICYWSLKFGAGAFRMEMVSEWIRPRGGEDNGVVNLLSGKGLVMVEYGSGLEMSPGWRAAPGKLDEADASG